MKKVITICILISLIVGAIMTIKSFRGEQNEMIQANVEALSSGENNQCIYNREETTCHFHLSAAAALFWGIHVDEDIDMELDGHVICSTGGNQCCTPVECIDLLKAIFGN